MSSGQLRKPLNPSAYLPPRRTCLKDDFKLYEVMLLVLTQLGYIPVTATMLMTAFYDPSKELCAERVGNVTMLESWPTYKQEKFFSLTVMSGDACSETAAKVTAQSSTMLMIGSLIGSMLGGVLADNFGRKHVATGCLAFIGIGNMALCFTFNFRWTWMYVFTVQLGTGVFCGGYMVSNFVLLTEAFELGRSRLLAVSLNGWSIGMVMTGLLALATKHYFWYHFIMSVAALILATLAQLKFRESCRWLASTGDTDAAKKAALSIAAVNKVILLTPKIAKWNEVLGFAETPQVKDSSPKLELARNWNVLRDVLVMTLCFTSCSTVSFGYYFNIDFLPGNRPLNMTATGLLKFILGLVPFLTAGKISRRVIFCASIGVCLIASVGNIIVSLFWEQSILFVVFSYLILAGMDPAWKINHLYTSELFPTPVRSIARGVCNAGARLGSVLAPTIIYSHIFYPALPHLVFAVLVLVQFLVIIFYLPDDETRSTTRIEEEEQTSIL